MISPLPMQFPHDFQFLPKWLNGILKKTLNLCIFFQPTFKNVPCYKMNAFQEYAGQVNERK